MEETWDTEDELQFLKGLGTWADPTKRAFTPERRETLLRNYRKTLLVRDVFDGIDRNVLLDYIDREYFKEA